MALILISNLDDPLTKKSYIAVTVKLARKSVMMALKPKIFCLRFGFWGFLLTPILASVSEGSLGQRKKRESVVGLSPITNFVKRPLFTTRSRPACWSWSLRPKIWLKILGFSGLAGSRQSVKISTLGRFTPSGKLSEGQSTLIRICLPGIIVSGCSSL